MTGDQASGPRCPNTDLGRREVPALPAFPSTRQRPARGTARMLPCGTEHLNQDLPTGSSEGPTFFAKTDTVVVIFMAVPVVVRWVDTGFLRHEERKEGISDEANPKNT